VTKSWNYDKIFVIIPRFCIFHHQVLNSSNFTKIVQDYLKVYWGTYLPWASFAPKHLCVHGANTPFTQPFFMIEFEFHIIIWFSKHNLGCTQTNPMLELKKSLFWKIFSYDYQACFPSMAKLKAWRFLNPVPPWSLLTERRSQDSQCNPRVLLPLWPH
jgi:hypothetical protein